MIGGISLNGAFAFGSQGEPETFVVHGRVTRDENVRYGPGLFAGLSWNIGQAQQ